MEDVRLRSRGRYLKADRADDGIAALQVLSELRERVNGVDDPLTLTVTDCLATAYRLAGRHADAVRLGEAVVAARTRVLGAAHLDTLVSRLGLGLAHAETRADSWVVDHLRRAMDDAADRHGPAHLHTIAIRVGLARCLELTGNRMAAGVEFDRAIADGASVLGADHSYLQQLRAERDELGAEPA